MAHTEAPKLALGLDIGSVNTHLVLAKGNELIHLDKERNYKGLARTLGELFGRLPPESSLENIAAAGVTGSGRHAYDRQHYWQKFSTPYADIAGILWDQPNARTIVEIGGQGALVIGLNNGLDSHWKVARSPLCAAGTGRFLEQQAARLRVSIEEFGAIALQCTGDIPRIATRCSVFAKSDLIHLQQKGRGLPDMLAGLSTSVAQMIVAQWRNQFVEPVVFVGGVAQNQGITRALAKAIRAEQILVPPNPSHRGAIGAALLAQKTEVAPTQLYPTAKEEKTYHIMQKLKPVTFQETWRPVEIVRGTRVSIGIDVGSTSTKAVVVDSEGNVLDKVYLMTAGQPLEAVKQIMTKLAPLQEKVQVEAVGVTGSGRYLIGDFVGADLIKNEITAQVRATRLIDPDVDTIFELGGQDSKYVFLKNGTVLDYQMNKACAAGTGSFIDELAEQLGVSTRSGEFASLAFEAEYRLDLGEKCTAFMSQAVTVAQQQSEPISAIVASLASSLAKNYRSKVVGNRSVGNRIFLPGAVFYNAAVVSAFKNEFPGKTFIVPEHKEVTGAIGAALLAREAMSKEQKSNFKGFSKIAEASYKLTSLNCKRCDHNCAISAMATQGRDGKDSKAYFGSRCDSFDSITGENNGNKGKDTPFTQREELLYKNYSPEKGTGKKVGVPRALMTHDLAPLIISFLNELGVQVEVSSPTNNKTVQNSLDRAYTDSCYPIKLLHGHVEELLGKGAGYIMILDAIRMGEKNGDEDQRYSCPLVQAAPYTIKAVFGLGDKLLDPVIDFSRGDGAVIDSFAEIAMRLGFSRKAGEKAARKGLLCQRDFEAEMKQRGREVLNRLENDPNALGVVLLARAYNAQDQGANLGMAGELNRLNLIPIPLDFLPLDGIDVREISDRPYWNYERKLLAAAKLISEHPKLFGLFLSNFGCGPNSFIENIIRDIMGEKPLGSMEVDEHAAEAGLITRIEALADTIREYRRSGFTHIVNPETYIRRVPTSVRKGEHILIARMSDHAGVIAAAMRSFGVDATVLPEPDDRSMALSRDVTNGKECLPFRDTLGVFLRMAQDGQIPPGARALMAGSFGPCRLGKYAQEQQKILRDQGIELEVMTTVSNNAYADLGLGPRFELLAWQGALVVDNLQKLLWSTRPYEKQPGESDRAYREYVESVQKYLKSQRPLEKLMRQASADFADIRDSTLPKRPLIGINGEIYLRANEFCNNDLVRVCEANGLEAEVAPMSEWIKYVTERNLEDGWKNHDLGRVLKGFLRKLALERYEKRVFSWFSGALHETEPSTSKLLRASSLYLPDRNGSEAVLSLGSGIRQMKNPHFAGVISVMPHGCMPGGIVAAFSEQISRQYGKPWISLTYDGFADKVNPERVADFAEQLRHSSRH